MSLATWEDLQQYYCATKWNKCSGRSEPNPFFEEMANRRYNYAAFSDYDRCRFIFLKEVLKSGDNKTLVRKGRFIWCRNLRYEGKMGTGLRHISFTVDSGQKRFTVAENNMLCLPSKTFISNNQFFRHKASTFRGFSSAFAYKQAFRMMVKGSGNQAQEFVRYMEEQNPHKVGTLVAPRLGYFYPDITRCKGSVSQQHPYGIIMGTSFARGDHPRREFYRVRFGGTIYEQVHPVQMEIINEV